MTEDFKTSLIASIDRVEGVKSFRFEKPENFTFNAGQFFIITIFPGHKKEMTKHFSFSSSPTEQYIEFTTRMTGSDFKNTLAEIQKGEEVIVKAPLGQFILDDSSKIAFLIGGIGVTPARSICKYCTDTNSDKEIIVFYGNSQVDGITFKRDFELMSKINKNLRVVHILSNPDKDWSGYQGFLNAEIIQKEAGDYLQRSFYISGPPGMVQAMRELLDGMQVSPEKIHMESFAGYE